MLQEKDKQIEELTRMLRQKQRLVEVLKMQLELGKREGRVSEPVVLVRVKQEPPDKPSVPLSSDHPPSSPQTSASACDMDVTKVTVKQEVTEEEADTCETTMQSQDSNGLPQSFSQSMETQEHIQLHMKPQTKQQHVCLQQTALQLAQQQAIQKLLLQQQQQQNIQNQQHMNQNCSRQAPGGQQNLQKVSQQRKRKSQKQQLPQRQQRQLVQEQLQQSNQRQVQLKQQIMMKKQKLLLLLDQQMKQQSKQPKQIQIQTKIHVKQQQVQQKQQVQQQPAQVGN